MPVKPDKQKGGNSRLKCRAARVCVFVCECVRGGGVPNPNPACLFRKSCGTSRAWKNVARLPTAAWLDVPFANNWPRESAVIERANVFSFMFGRLCACASTAYAGGGNKRTVRQENSLHTRFRCQMCTCHGPRGGRSWLSHCTLLQRGPFHRCICSGCGCSGCGVWVVRCELWAVVVASTIKHGSLSRPSDTQLHQRRFNASLKSRHDVHATLQGATPLHRHKRQP
jgi:hypothetical protein